MTIQLNIANDAELRQYIKEQIKGQVLSIAREEVLNLVKQEFEKKLSLLDQVELQKLFNKAAESHIKQIVSNDDITGIAKTIANKYISQAMSDKDWGKLIDAAAKKKLSSLIDS